MTTTKKRNFSSYPPVHKLDALVRYKHPVWRILYSPNLSAVRVCLKIPRLSDNGNAAQVDYQILLSHDGNHFNEVVSDSMQGKTDAPYVRFHEIELEGEAPWAIGVVRPEPASDDPHVYDDLYFDSYAVIQYEKEAPIKQGVNWAKLITCIVIAGIVPLTFWRVVSFDEMDKVGVALISTLFGGVGTAFVMVMNDEDGE